MAFKLVPRLKSTFRPTVEVLDSSTNPMYSGEKLIIDASQGPYVVAITMHDTRPQSKSNLSLKWLQHTDSSSIVNSVRVAYPGDDSMMIIYVSCKARPVVKANERLGALIVHILPE